MDANRLNTMVSVAHQVYDLYIDEENGRISDDFISVDVVINGRPGHYAPAVLLTDDAFYDLVNEKGLEVILRDNDPTRPCAYFAGVRFKAIISMEKAAALGYLKGAENEFYRA